MTLQRPGHGEPCNSCGFCCQRKLCPLAMGVFRGGNVLTTPDDGPCPALEQDGERFVCGLVAHPMAYNITQTLRYGQEAMAVAARSLVGSGIGCDCALVDEPVNVEFEEHMRKVGTAPKRQRQVDIALRLWGLRR